MRPVWPTIAMSALLFRLVRLVGSKAMKKRWAAKKGHSRLVSVGRTRFGHFLTSVRSNVLFQGEVGLFEFHACID